MGETHIGSVLFGMMDVTQTVFSDLETGRRITFVQRECPSSGALPMWT